MRREWTTKIGTVVLTGLLSLGALTGCDETVVVTNQPNNSANNSTNNVGNNDHNAQNNDHNAQNNEHIHEDDEGHGLDDDAVLIETGYLSGTWRVARADDDTPLVIFDLIHDADATLVEGDFMMSIAISDLLDGTTGEIKEAKIEGPELTINWNPTTDEEELYVIDSAVKVDENRMTGQFRATRGPYEFAVTLDRRLFDDDDDDE